MLASYYVHVLVIKDTWARSDLTEKRCSRISTFYLCIVLTQATLVILFLHFLKLQTKSSSMVGFHRFNVSMRRTFAPNFLMRAHDDDVIAHLIGRLWSIRTMKMMIAWVKLHTQKIKELSLMLDYMMVQNWLVTGLLPEKSLRLDEALLEVPSTSSVALANASTVLRCLLAVEGRRVRQWLKSGVTVQYLTSKVYFSVKTCNILRYPALHMKKVQRINSTFPPSPSLLPLLIDG